LKFEVLFPVSVLDGVGSAILNKEIDGYQPTALAAIK
jgi:hypothetical protein